MQTSVVMPYWENQRTLPACLLSFARQSHPPAEIVVVDDGSATPAVAPPDLPVPVRILRPGHGGQSAATNVGIAAAKGDLVLLTCADIVADPHLVATHLEAHARAPDERLGVGGRIAYAGWLPRTPFMRFLATDGVQFSFGEIEDPEHMPPMMCYAPNFSARRDDLLALGGFDERFDYGFQDSDLGLRLAHRRGVRLVYRERALAHHDHPNTLRRFAARNRRVGVATVTLWEKYPAYAGRLRQQVRRQIALALRGLPQLDGMLAEAEALEARLRAAAELPPELVRQLDRLFATVCHLALFDGILSQAPRLAALQMLPAGARSKLAPRAAQGGAT